MLAAPNYDRPVGTPAAGARTSPARPRWPVSPFQIPNSATMRPVPHALSIVRSFACLFLIYTLLKGNIGHLDTKSNFLQEKKLMCGLPP